MRLTTGVLCGLWATLPALAQEMVPAPPVRADMATPAATAAPVTVEFKGLAVRSRPRPSAYPPLARVARVEGTVRLRLTVDPQGRVERAEALEGPGLLRDAAEAYLRLWTFQPTLQEGRAVRVQCELPVPFHLGDGPGAGTPPAKVVFEITPGSLDGPQGLTLDQLKAELQPMLDRAGLRSVPSSEADPGDTLHLRLEVKTRRAGGLFLCETRERCSRWGDRDLAANEDGKPTRIAFLGHLMAQKGDATGPDFIQVVVRRTLGDLLVAPPPRVPVGKPGSRPPDRPMDRAKSAGGPPNSTGPGPVDFDFSQIKVKQQPPAPPYPTEAKLSRVQGTVVVELTVSPEGTPIYVEALEGPGPLFLTALSYALDWRFQPALINGVPQYARFKLTMPFRLR